MHIINIIISLHFRCGFSEGFSTKLFYKTDVVERIVFNIFIYYSIIILTTNCMLLISIYN